MRLVVDASVVLKWFLKEKGSTHAREYLARFRAGQDDLIAPDLLVSEVGNGLRSAALSKRLDAGLAEGAFADFLAMDVSFVPMSRIGSKAIELALTNNTSFYDAAYVALALAEQLPVLAVDGPMSQRLSGTVEFLLLRTDDADLR